MSRGFGSRQWEIIEACRSYGATRQARDRWLPVQDLYERRTGWERTLGVDASQLHPEVLQVALEDADDLVAAGELSRRYRNRLGPVSKDEYEATRRAVATLVYRGVLEEQRPPGGPRRVRLIEPFRPLSRGEAAEKGVRWRPFLREVHPPRQPQRRQPRLRPTAYRSVPRDWLVRRR